MDTRLSEICTLVKNQPCDFSFFELQLVLKLAKLIVNPLVMQKFYFESVLIKDIYLREAW